MAEEKAKKVNNASKYISKDVIVIAVVLIAIAAYIIACLLYTSDAADEL
mgnify:CR=1 FL=1